MSFNFEYTLSWFNVWIIVVPIWLLDFSFGFFKREGFRRAGDTSWYTGSVRIKAFSSMFLMILYVVYSIVVSIKSESVWLYIGLVFVVTGFAGKFIAQINFYSSPLGEPINTGIYRISRNPMYFFGSLVLLGGSLISQSGILLILTLLAVFFTHLTILAEESTVRLAMVNPI